MDTKKRSFVKSLTWRMTAVFVLGTITYAVTRKLGETTFITLLYHGIQIILHYWHDRIWERTKWGTILHPLAHFQVRPDLTAKDHATIRKFLEDQEYVAQPPEYEI